MSESKQTATKKGSKPTAGAPKKAVKSGPLKVAKDFYYGTGRRKEAIAKAWVFSGSGKVEVNKKPMETYFTRHIHKNVVNQPLTILSLDKKYDIKLSVLGGGISGQADASRLAIARAILKLNEEFRKSLKPEGILTCDARVKERKKYGRKRARKGYQFRKR